MAEGGQNTPEIIVRPKGHHGQRTEFVLGGKFAENQSSYRSHVETYHCTELRTKEKFLLRRVYLEGAKRNDAKRRDLKEVPDGEAHFGGLSPDDVKRRQYELELWPTLHHDNILTFVDGWQKGGTLYFISSPAKWSLDVLLFEKGQEPSEDLYLKWLYQIASALKYLHEEHTPSQPVLHRNLKPGSIFVTDAYVLKLTNFGSSKMLMSDMTVKGSIVGSAQIMSPEMLTKEQYNSKTDIWSFGITAVFIATMNYAVRGTNFDTIFRKTKEGEISIEDWPYSENVQNVVNRLLHKDPHYRPSASNFLRDLLLVFGDACSEPPQPASYPGVDDFPEEAEDSPRPNASAFGHGQSPASSPRDVSYSAQRTGVAVSSIRTRTSRSGASQKEESRPVSSARHVAPSPQYRDAFTPNPWSSLARREEERKGERFTRSSPGNLAGVTAESLSLAVLVCITKERHQMRVDVDVKKNYSKRASLPENCTPQSSTRSEYHPRSISQPPERHHYPDDVVSPNVQQRSTPSKANFALSIQFGNMGVGKNVNLNFEHTQPSSRSGASSTPRHELSRSQRRETERHEDHETHLLSESGYRAELGTRHPTMSSNISQHTPHRDDDMFGDNDDEVPELINTFPGAFGVQRRQVYSGPLKPIVRPSGSQKKKEKKKPSKKQSTESISSASEAGDDASVFEETQGGGETRDETQARLRVRPHSESDMASMVASPDQPNAEVPPDRWHPTLQGYWNIASDLNSELGPDTFWTAINLIRVFSKDEVKLWLEENGVKDARDCIQKLEKLMRLDAMMASDVIKTLNETLRQK